MNATNSTSLPSGWKTPKTGELVTNADAAEQGVLFADDADGLVSDFIEAIIFRRSRLFDQLNRRSG
jgi:hypothetical protein